MVKKRFSALSLFRRILFCLAILSKMIRFPRNFNYHRDIEVEGLIRVVKRQNNFNFQKIVDVTEFENFEKIKFSAMSNFGKYNNLEFLISLTKFFNTITI